jgi:hypothetical protein
MPDVNMLPDLHGTVRRETLVVAYLEKSFPSQALQTARVALGVPDEELVVLWDQRLVAFWVKGYLWASPSAGESANMPWVGEQTIASRTYA